MKNAAKLTASAAAVICAVVLIAACYYYYSLPDKFYVRENSKLTLSSYLDAQPIKSSRENFLSLKLFGVVPIKNVQTLSTDSPLVYPGGEPFGIKILSDGVMVVELQKGSCPARDCGIKCGDVILSVNDVPVNSNAEISQLIRSCDGQTVRVKLMRDGEEKILKLTPEVADGSYRAGMWVRDSSAGIGTVTFYTDSGVFGGLGHPVCDIDTGDSVPIRDGQAADVKIHDFTKSENGKPGALLGGFTAKGDIGKIYANKHNGVFGQLNAFPDSKAAIPLGYRQEIKKGKAFIFTTVSGNTPQKYEISIEEIRLDGSDSKNLVIKVTDRRLLSKTGGILQGMSGSPIIQDGKLIGAVTHVFVNDVTMGYGAFADDMYFSALDSCGISYQKEAA